ncbi:hypothetical protein IM40_05225 [Candidatus Paracaedimonas acanthamoebae]|nr:hypothetical protein IM40_05225 [Candidatus Paracaedimonas acanthamoebae]
MLKKSIPFACILLTACGSSKTMVLDTCAETKYVKNFELIHGKSTTSVPKEAQELFRNIIDKKLTEIGYSKGNELIIEYRFIQFDEGDQFARWMWGGLGNSGEGEMTAEVRFKDLKGNELSKIHVGGKISSGVFGGSFDHAVENAAHEVVRYVEKSFPKATA